VELQEKDYKLSKSQLTNISNPDSRFSSW